MTERQEGDRVVVTGYSGANHFPRNQAMTQLRFEADGLTDAGPYAIEGSVYGRDLRFRGPGCVNGPVLGRGDIELTNPSSEPQRFLGGLHANGNVVCDARAIPLEQTLTASIRNARLVVVGDVIGEHVYLEDALVFGSVRGRTVRLKSCIVFGYVVATEKAVIAASTVLAFDAHELCIAGPCLFLHALGASDVAPVLTEFVDGAGKTWPLDLRYYPILRCDGGSLSNRPWLAPSPHHAAGRLVAADFLRVEAQKAVRAYQGSEIVETQVLVQRHVFTVAGRVLNFASLVEPIQRLTWVLKSALEFSHYSPVNREKVRAEWARECTKDEADALALATAPMAKGPR